MNTSCRLLILVFLICIPSGASALSPTADLRIVPIVQEGESLSVDVRLDTGGVAVGGVQVQISHSSNIVLSDSDGTDSVFSQGIVEPKANGDSLRFVRVRFDEGFSGDDGQLIRLTFQVLESGDTDIQIDTDASEVVAYADSSNILQKTQGISANLSDSGTATNSKISSDENVKLEENYPSEEVSMPVQGVEEIESEELFYTANIVLREGR